MKIIEHQPILVFDGVCNLCTTSIQKIIKIDKNNKFRFASLQSDAGKEILLHFSGYNSKIDSVFLVYNDKLHSKSSAVIRVFKIVGGIYRFALIFWIIPKPLRDVLYDFIAKNRYKWFGKRDKCMIPNKDLKHKFLD